MPEIEPFDYETVIDPADRAWLREQVRGIAAAMCRTVEGILDAGRRLSEVRDRLGRRRFKRWVLTEFPQSYVTACRRVAAWRETAKISRREIMDPEVLAYLASPMVPVKARREVASRLRKGEKVDVALARSIVQLHRAPRRSRVLALAAQMARDDDEGQGVAPGPVRIETGKSEIGGTVYRLILDGMVLAEGDTLAEAVERITPGAMWLRGCSTCKVHKPLTDFSHKKDGPGGRNWACRQCESGRALEAKRAKRAKASPVTR